MLTDKQKIEELRKIIVNGFDEVSAYFEEDRSYSHDEIMQVLRDTFLGYIVTANGLIIPDEKLQEMTDYIFDRTQKGNADDADRSKG